MNNEDLYKMAQESEREFYTWGIKGLASLCAPLNPDHLLSHNDKAYLIEIKKKTKRFIGSKDDKEFQGFGINVRQFNQYSKYFIMFNLRCLFCVKEGDSGKWFMQWLDKLNNRYEANNETYIFPVDQFVEVDKYSLQKNLLNFLENEEKEE